MPSGILLDIGGTLWSEDRFDPEAGTARVLQMAHNPRGVTVRDVQDMLTEIERDLAPRRESSWFEFQPTMVHRHVYEPLGITFDKSFEEMEFEFCRAAMDLSPIPGVLEALAYVKARNITMGVVSNSTFTSQTLSRQLDMLHMRDFFEFVISSAEYTIRKPHPQLFITAVRKLGTEKGDTWHIGDSLRYDIAGAKSAGLVTVLYSANAVEDCSEADYLLENWSGFKTLLENNT